MEKFFDFLFRLICYRVGARISNLMSISDGLDSHIFMSRYGKSAVYERTNGQRGVYFPRWTAFFLFRQKISTFLFFYLELVCKHLCFPQGRGINERSGSTITIEKHKL